MMKGLTLIFFELQILISDPKTEWKTINEIWKSIEVKKTINKNSRWDDENEDIEIVVDQFVAQKDFVAFVDENENSENWKNRMNETDEKTRYNSENWKNRLNETDENDVQGFLNQNERNEDFDVFETLYRT